MTQALPIGTVSSPTDGLVAQREGNQITLRQGDAVLAGDVLQNKGDLPVEIRLPGLLPEQADSLVSLAPNAAAQVLRIENGANALIEVNSLSNGVELFAVSEGTEGAMLVADSGEAASGLVGVGLLSAGSAGTLAGVGTVATAIGGGVGAVALLATPEDDNLTNSAFVDVRVDNPEASTEPVAEPEPEPQPSGLEPLTQPVTDALNSVIEPIADALGQTPLATVTDPLFDVLSSLPIGSATSVSDVLPLNEATGNLPI